MSRNLSTAEVSRILGMKEARIREIVRSGFLRPARRGRRYAFSFQDLVVLRAARELIDKRVPAARVRRALAALARELPEDRPLSGLRILADGRHVAVENGDTRWQPETGQTLLFFDVDPLFQEVERIREEPAGQDPALLAFQEALEQEGIDPAAACAAYNRALSLDADLADAWVNLGRIAHEAGDAREAARLYHEALARTPDDPIVHFNLALALEDTKGAAAALTHYQRALELDPDFADAHYNLAGLYEQLGRAPEALRHYRAYKQLTDS